MPGFDLSPAALIVGLLLGTVGFGLFLYGKRSGRPPQLVAGLALMGLPYCWPSAPGQLAASAGVVGLLWLSLRAGH